MLNVYLDAWTSFVTPSTPLAPERSAGSPVQAAGTFISQRFDADFGSLAYKLYIPSSYTGASMPLVVMLHGCGQDANDFALGTGMNALAEKYQCLVAYPEQCCGANWNRCWNWFDEAHHQRGRGEPGLIAGITEKILAEYSVDRTRVYAAGLSSGGAMAVILGRTYPDLFTAIGCHSGLAHGSATDSYSAFVAMRDGAGTCALADSAPCTSPPIIVFHGDLDATVNVKNSAAVVRQTIDDYTMGTTEESKEVALLEETGEITGRVFTRRIHTGNEGRVVAEHWTVHGAGHAWSGGSRHGSYTDANGPDASEEILRFFMQTDVTPETA